MVYMVDFNVFLRDVKKVVWDIKFRWNCMFVYKYRFFIWLKCDIIMIIIKM